MFKGLGNLGDMGKMLKQAMEMKQKMEALKEELADEEVEASAGGMVRVRMNGRMELLELEIQPDIISPEQREELEVIVRTAVNEGIRKTQAMMQERMQELTGGMDIPGIT